MIIEHNNNPDATFDMEHNRFSDLVSTLHIFLALMTVYWHCLRPW